ncbi:MAG: acyl-CoA thioesterase II [Hellea sp.]|nr:acyl-CoA thioesterase II [Hellea sp.]
MFTWQELRDTLHVEQIDKYLFTGKSLSFGLKRVFGGQVLAQCLNAAYRSVDEDKVPHSLHGYFLRPGDFNRPIIYEVDPIRNGRSFSTRRIVARQNGEAIFNSSVSFHKIEDGPSHQFDMPDNIPMPEDVVPDARLVKELGKNLNAEARRKLGSSYLIFSADIIDLRSPFLGDLLEPQKQDPVHGFWFKVKPDVGDDAVMHMTLLSFISDKALMSTGIRPHGEGFFTGKMMGASLDHAMWFHGNINVNEWNYYHLDSPRSGRARTFNRGSFYSENGRLIASTAQEGLFRFIEK